MELLGPGSTVKLQDSRGQRRFMHYAEYSSEVTLFADHGNDGRHQGVSNIQIK